MAQDNFMNFIEPYNSVFYMLPEGAWYRRAPDGTWKMEEPLMTPHIKVLLKDAGEKPDDIEAWIGAQAYRVVYGRELVPGQGRFANLHGECYFNLYDPPTLQPIQGECPRIQRVLSTLTGHDEEGARWVKNFLAFKVQKPLVETKTSVVFSTKPGAGKGILFRVIEEIVGRGNCVEIGRGDLENKFNAMWAQKLIILANEITNPENRIDISQRLKALIDSPYIVLEGKGKDQKYVKNRSTWIFASNDPAPIQVDPGDRRYSFFSNHEELTKEYRDTLNGCFEADRHTLTPSFKAEVEAFYYELLHLDVDEEFIKFPYQNKSRESLIVGSEPTSARFIREVGENGLKPFLDAWLAGSGSGREAHIRKEWDFGEEGVKTTHVYKAYRFFAESIGGKAKGDSKFGVDVLAAGWERRKVRYTDASGEVKAVNCYVVPKGQYIRTSIT